jgi:hypothetical protein
LRAGTNNSAFLTFCFKNQELYDIAMIGVSELAASHVDAALILKTQESRRSLWQM